MSETCLNPDCSNTVQAIGVCLECANGSYKPKRDGVDTEGTYYQ